MDENKNSLDIKTALSEIQKRADERKKLKDESSRKLVAARKARREDRSQSGSGGRLQGLASFKNTLGTQYYKQPDSENS